MASGDIERDLGVSVKSKEEALARLLHDREDLDLCIELVRHEIAQETT